MQRARDEFLARAALAADEHRGIRGRYLAQALIKLAHRRGLADQRAIRAQWRFQALAQRAGFARQRRLLQSLFQNLAQPRHVRNASPLMPGIMRSVTTACGNSLSHSLSAALPSGAAVAR